MGYEIIAVGCEGEEVARLETKIVHAPAHLLMGALGLDYDQDDESGEGDVYQFTDDELSAAEDALMVILMPDGDEKDGIEQGLVFLGSARQWLKDGDRGCIEIGFF